MRLGPLCLSFAVACTTDSGEPASNPDAASQGDVEVRDEATREGASSVEPSTPPADAQPPAPEPVVPTPSPQLEIAFVGDVIFGRYRSSGFDAIVEGDADPWADIRNGIDADLLVGNLETPLMEDLPAVSPSKAKHAFGGSRALVRDVLVPAGFDVMSVANNHHYDLRRPGQEQTPGILKDAGIFPIGAAVEEGPTVRVETFARDGWKIGFIAATTKLNMPERSSAMNAAFVKWSNMSDTVVPLVEQARQDHDLVVVALHWGSEYTDLPGSGQRRAAHKLIQAGADVVWGHHPHVLQSIEHYEGGVIAYSMGNFLFENVHDPMRLTGVLKLRFTRSTDGAGCLDRARFHPAIVRRNPIPHPVSADGDAGKKVRERVIKLSKSARTEWSQVDGSEELELPALPACP